MYQKLTPDTFLILLNNPKQPWKKLFKIRCFERGLWKCLAKFNFIFSFEPVPFDWESYQKQKGSETSDQLLFWLWNKFKSSPLFVIYYLTKFNDVMQSSFWAIPKITSANLRKLVHDIINYFTFICPFEYETCRKEGKNYKNLNNSRMKRAF